MIHFNDEQASKMRGKEERLSLEEETQAIQLMNEALECLSGRRIVKKGEIKLLQRFVSNYENMNHYTNYSSGLWCTDTREKVIDNEKILFELSYGD